MLIFFVSLKLEFSMINFLFYLYNCDTKVLIKLYQILFVLKYLRSCKESYDKKPSGFSTNANNFLLNTQYSTKILILPFPLFLCKRGFSLKGNRLPLEVCTVKSFQQFKSWDLPTLSSQRERGNNKKIGEKIVPCYLTS